MATAFDHIKLDDTDRQLVEMACAEAPKVSLQELDKGLSGAAVWLAEWQLPSGLTAKPHVFKIGDYEKLTKELKASQFASTIEPGFPAMTLFPESGAARGNRGLLRQEFVGGVSPKNLRMHIANDITDENGAVSLIENLFRDRLCHWHPADVAFKHEAVVLGEALDRWGVVDVFEGAAEIGDRALDESLLQQTGVSLADVAALRDRLADVEEEIVRGPVHGDLHSQNVLIGSTRLELIDFALCGEKWRALDFLMMECSLKLLVVPPHARLADLIELERTLEPALSGGEVVLADVASRMFGAQLVIVGAAIATVRRLALELGAVVDGAQYRRGLFMMLAGLATLPEIHKPYLFHACGVHAAAMGTVVVK
jgi:hypothetical protein